MPKPKRTQNQNTDPHPFAFQQVRDPETGEYSWKRLVSPQIPDEILTTGNPSILQSFYETHKDTLTPADTKYMLARMHTAFKLERLERESQKLIRDGGEYPKPEVTTKKGYIGLDSIRLPRPQTSNCGCWSCGMSLLLKSRGIDMTQEEIRAYRPDFQPGEEQKMTAERRRILDSDNTNYLYDSSDLIHKVLPNTAVTQVTLTPLNDTDFTVQGGKELPKLDERVYGLPQAQMEAALDTFEKELAKARGEVRKAYYEQVRQQMGGIIRNSLEQDKSPVVLNIGGSHYITVTGISENGKTIRVEDSLRSQDNTTQYLSLDDLIQKNLCAGGPGMSMTWLKDLPAPQYVPGNDNERDDLQQLQLFEGGPGAVTAQQRNGEIELKLHDVPDTNIIASTADHSNVGMLKGQEISNSIPLDQTYLSQKLGGGLLKRDVVRMDGPESQMFFGDQTFYYPKKLIQVGDPQLSNEKLQQKSLDAQKNVINEMNEKLRRQPVGKSDPEKNTFAREIHDHKQALYLQDPDPAYHISRLYAAQKMLQEKIAQGADPENRKITPEDKTRMYALASNLNPSVQAILAKPEGKVSLPMLAVDDDPNKLINAVDDFVKQRADAVNPDKEQHLNTVAEAGDLLERTGTGKNYFGIKRNANKSEYTKMMESLGVYKAKLEQKTATGYDAYNVQAKALKYIRDKKTVRSTTTGKIRFDNTMRVLQQIMPADEFRKVCNSINRARGVASSPKDPNYVSVHRYAPQTPSAIAAQRAEWLPNASKSEAVKGLSEILAAQEIAKERNPQNSGKAIVISAAHEKEDRQLLERKASEIRRNPAFRSIVSGLSEDPSTRRNQVRNLCAEGGKNLTSSLTRAQQQLMQPSTQMSK